MTSPSLRRQNACGGRFVRYASACSDRFLIGRVVGDWRLDAVLGQGRFGTTYRATSMDPHGGGEQAALKLVKPSNGVLDTDAVWAETAALSLCDHPSIPRWLGILNMSCQFGEADILPATPTLPQQATARVFQHLRVSDTRYFVIQALMPGKSLSRLLHRSYQLFDATSRAFIGAQLIDSLDHAFGRGVVHNDVRSANILVDEQNRVSLVDFGLSNRFDREKGSELFAATTLSDRGGLADILLFMLYSDSSILRLHDTRQRNRPWYDDLALSPNQRDFLLDLYSETTASQSYAEIRNRFEMAFSG